MKKAIYISIFLLICVVSIIMYYRYTIHINDERHLTASYTYAHFSKINAYNFFLFPNFLLKTSPLTFRLTDGDSLYIPKYWWHWVVTVKKTHAMNFWIQPKNESHHKPFVIKDLYNADERKHIINYINADISNNHICIWDSNHDAKRPVDTTKGSDFIQSNKDNKYLITLDGYDKCNWDDNRNLKEKIKNNINVPEYMATNNLRVVDTNLWISSKYNDTGLHYDDNAGILHVLAGEKYVTLYPPSDHLYLEPYSIIPNYARQSAIRMKYNEYTIIDIESRGKSSEFMLFKTLEYMAKSQNVFKAIQKIYDSKHSEKKIIWGFKKHNDEYRWEIYYYHYLPNDIGNTHKCELNDFLKDNKYPLTEQTISDLQDEKTIIHSIDIFNNDTVFNTNEVHTYKCSKKESVLPFHIIGYDYINNKRLTVSTTIYDSYNHSLKNSKTHFEKLGLDYNDNIGKLLKKYKSLNLNISNKKGQYFIQWLTITVDSFIEFLEEFNYNKMFTEHVKNNRNNYMYIGHDITIVYDKDLNPVRTGFYGCL